MQRGCIHIFMKDRARFHWALWPYQVINVLREKWSRLIFSESIGSTQYIGRESARTDAEFRCWIRRNIFSKKCWPSGISVSRIEPSFFFKILYDVLQLTKRTQRGEPKTFKHHLFSPGEYREQHRLCCVTWRRRNGLFSYYCRCILLSWDVCTLEEKREADQGSNQHSRLACRAPSNGSTYLYSSTFCV